MILDQSPNLYLFIWLSFKNVDFFNNEVFRNWKIAFNNKKTYQSKSFQRNSMVKF